MNHVNTINVRYSAFLGMMYPANGDYDAAIVEAKAVVGEAAVKAGFTGKNGESPTAKAIACIAARGLRTENQYSGRLTSVAIRLKGSASQPYLQVGLRSDTESCRYMISLPLNGSSVPALIRKLAECDPDLPTKVSLFALYERSKTDGKMYGNHHASVSQNGVKVGGLSVDALRAMQAQTVSQLKSLGLDSKEVMSKAKEKAQADYLTSLVTLIEARFSAFYEAKYPSYRAAAAEQPPEPAESTPVDYDF